MKEIRWNKEKNEWLKVHRNISFEEVIFLIETGLLLGKKKHHNQFRYPGQWIFFVKKDNHVFEIPFVEEPEYIFLKTIYPSRKSTKTYLLNKKV